MPAKPAHAQATKDAAIAAELEEIVITADRKKSFGADFVQAGTFRNARQIDTPLTVTVVTRDVLDAQQASSVHDAIKNSAGVTMAQVGASVASNLSIRGIPLENRSSYRLNGSLPTVNLIDIPMEDKERVEVLKGVSALYYGFVPPSGIVNMTTKRPTQEPLTAITLLGNNHGTAGAHADISRRFLDDTVGVRINALQSSLNYGIDKTDGERSLAAVAIDWDPTETIKIRLDGEYVHKKVTEPTTVQVTAPAGQSITLPPLLDPSANLGAKWMYSDATSVNLLAHAEYRFLPNWSVMAEAGESHVNRDRRFSVFSFTNFATGAGRNTITSTNNGEYRNVNYRAEIAGAFDTWVLRHQISLGVTRNIRNQRVPGTTSQTFSQNYFQPISIPAQMLPPRGPVTNPQKIDDKGYYFFDSIKYSDWLELIVGVRRNKYSNTSALSKYTAQANTPTGGGVIKVLPWLSLYGTYIEGLEEGGVAPIAAKNANQALPPALSTQWEAGVKAEPMKGLLVTFAHFNIERAASFLNPATNIFVQDGRTEYKGYELSVTGEINEEWSIFLTGMQLDAIQLNASDPNVINKRPENTPRWAGSLFAEYRVPMVPGLSINGGVYYVGSRPINATNQAFVPSYHTFSLGARYTVDVRDVPVTFGVAIDNLTNEKYWAGTGSGYLSQGLPLTAKFQVTARF